MSNIMGFNRRNFLRSAGLTAFASAAGSNAAFADSSAQKSGGGASFLHNGKYDFDTPYNRFGTHCYKWDDQVRRYGAEKFQIGMGVASMDFQAPPCIGQALAERCAHENWGYMFTPDSFLEAIVDWNRDRHGYKLDPGSIQISAGIYPAIIAALRTFVEPGSKVLLQTPAYSGFYYHISHTRTLPVESEMYSKNGRYEIDWEDLESRMTPDVQAMIVCNPHNPTGNVWSESDLLRVGRMCLEHRIVVLADEVHCDLVRTGEKYVPFASLPDKEVVDNSISFKALSKTFNLASMKNAYFFSTNPVYLERVKSNHRPDINALGIIANEAAYREGADYVDQLLPYLDENHSYVHSYVKQHIPAVEVTRAQGTYLSWLDISKIIEASGAAKAVEKNRQGGESLTVEQYMENWFVEHAGVQLHPGTKYGTGGPGHMRMNLGTQRQNIKQALDNIAEAVQGFS